MSYLPPSHPHSIMFFSHILILAFVLLSRRAYFDSVPLPTDLETLSPLRRSLMSPYTSPTPTDSRQRWTT